MPSIPSYLTKYFTKEQAKPPPISTGAAAALLVIYTLIYVVPFYLSPLTRPSRTLSRDAPSVIRARITSVSVTCVVCSGITFIILTSPSFSPGNSGGAKNTPSSPSSSSAAAFHSMGYWPVGLTETARSLLLTAILFAGPLYESLVVEQGWRGLDVRRLLFGGGGDSWTFWRNIVAGPITEEILFRSASVPLMLLAQTSPTRTIFLSPVIFGLAHAHHFYEGRLMHPWLPLPAAVARSVLQFSYTTLFGAYATFLFLRTGSLLSIVIVHAFCNVMGLPRFWGRVRFAYEWEEDELNVSAAAAAAAVANNKKTDDGTNATGSGGRRGPSSVLWTVVYYVLLVAGAVGWYKNLGVLTQSRNALAAIDL